MITVGQQWIDNRKRTRGRVIEILRVADFYSVQAKVLRDKDGEVKRSQVGKCLYLDKSRIVRECRLLTDEERIDDSTL